MALLRYPRGRKFVKGLLFLFISILGLIGLQLLPGTASEGWIHIAALLAALGLIAVALFEVLRER